MSRRLRPLVIPGTVAVIGVTCAGSGANAKTGTAGGSGAVSNSPTVSSSDTGGSRNDNHQGEIASPRSAKLPPSARLPRSPGSLPSAGSPGSRPSAGSPPSPAGRLPLRSAME